MHWTVGVEINPDVPISDHRNLKPGRQGLFIHQDLQRDTSQLRITDADGEKFRLIMTRMKSNGEVLYIKSPEIRAGCGAKTLEESIKKYYEQQGWPKPDITLECAFEDGTTVPEADCNQQGIKTHIYTIEVTKSISVPSQINVVPYKNGT